MRYFVNSAATYRAIVRDDYGWELGPDLGLDRPTGRGWGRRFGRESGGGHGKA